MNISFNELRSTTADTNNKPSDDQSAGNEFSQLFTQTLESRSDNSQVIELKEYFDNPDEFTSELEELLADQNLMTGDDYSVIEYVELDSESDPIAIDALAKGGSGLLADYNIDSATTEAALAGESLPMSGINLPSEAVASSASVNPAAANNSNSLLQMAQDKLSVKLSAASLQQAGAAEKTAIDLENVDLSLNSAGDGEGDSFYTKALIDVNQSIKSHALPEGPMQNSNFDAQQNTVSSSASLQVALQGLESNNQSARPNPLPPAMQSMNLLQGEDSGEWGKGIGERVSWMINQKQNLATIRLDPPSLGRLDIQIKIGEDSTTIVVQTQHAQTRDLVDAASHKLREFLQDSGFENVDVDVSHQQHPKDDDSGAGSTNATIESTEEQAFSVDSQTTEGESSSKVISGNRIVDTFV